LIALGAIVALERSGGTISGLLAGAADRLNTINAAVTAGIDAPNGVHGDTDSATACPAISDWSGTVSGTGYGGVVEVTFQACRQTGQVVEMDFPIVRLGAGANVTGWRALHAGGGNANGIETCNAICHSLGWDIQAGWDVPTGNGYPAGAEHVAGTCAFKDGGGDPAARGDWQDGYGATQTCGNPMYTCACNTS
jgi:hypothetical protein